MSLSLAHDVAAPAGANLRETTRFLFDIEVQHGPVEVIGHFFLRAAAAAMRRGVQLSFVSLEELVAINAANKETWRPLVPIFDPAHNDLGAHNSYAFVGRNTQGRVVAAQAGRVFDWTATSFQEEATSLRLFYADPDHARVAGERLVCVAQGANQITGTVTYSGATWFHPDYRGSGLGYLMARMSRAYAYTRWNSDFTISMMAEGVVNGGYAARCGYTDVNWGITMDNFDCVKTARLALVSMPRAQMLDDVETFIASFDVGGDAFETLNRRSA